MRVEDALTANRKTYLIYEWFQLVSGQFEKKLKQYKDGKMTGKIDVFSGDLQKAFSDSRLPYILRDI